MSSLFFIIQVLSYYFNHALAVELEHLQRLVDRHLLYKLIMYRPQVIIARKADVSEPVGKCPRYTAVFDALLKEPIEGSQKILDKYDWAKEAEKLYEVLKTL